jgi:hypothetical protein
VEPLGHKYSNRHLSQLKQHRKRRQNFSWVFVFNFSIVLDIPQTHKNFQALYRYVTRGFNIIRCRQPWSVCTFTIIHVQDQDFEWHVVVNTRAFVTLLAGVAVWGYLRTSVFSSLNVLLYFISVSTQPPTSINQATRPSLLCSISLKGLCLDNTGNWVLETLH